MDPTPEPDARPRSTAGRRCLTAPHQGGLAYFHPVTCTTARFTGATCGVMSMTPDMKGPGAPPFWARADPETSSDEVQFPDSLVLLLSDIFDPHAFLEDVYGIQTADDLHQWSENPKLHRKTLWRVHTVWWKEHVHRSADIPEVLFTWYYHQLRPNSHCTYDQFYTLLDAWIGETRPYWGQQINIISAFADHLREQVEAPQQTESAV